MLKHIANLYEQLKSLSTGPDTYTPSYRLVEITETDHEEYSVTIQVINKNATFKMKPEDILCDDETVDRFSPQDIRTLTYLGYLGVNAPKYKILAKRLSKQTNAPVFAVKKKGQKKVLLKTAEDIMKEKEVLNSLSPDQAHLVGYTVAAKSIQSEMEQKAALLKEAEQSTD